jgi:hypothetical protein
MSEDSKLEETAEAVVEDSATESGPPTEPEEAAEKRRAAAPLSNSPAASTNRGARSRS